MTTHASRRLLAAAALFALSGWAAAQTTINPTADAYVQGANNANNNFGTATQLKARTNATAAKNFDSYLKFDMSTVPAFSAVKLRLYAALSNTGSVGITLSAVSNTSWAETTITWNNKPALGTALASGTVTNKTFAWYEFDVTGYLAAERAAGRNVVSLALRAPTASSLTVKVKSRQASTNKPQFVSTLNAAPSVSLTAPTDGASYAAGAPITLTAAAADSDGTITKVEFFHGTSLIGTLTQAPYTFDWTNAGVGSYALTAKATDNLGTATTSSPVNVIVTGPPALYFIHPDHLNTPRVITNQAQQVVWRWDNDDPFGGNMANENPSGLGNFTCNLRFSGQYFDRETNNHYNYFRDYDPGIGRYVQSDPIGLRGGVNTYAYVRGNPVASVDSLGLLKWSGSFDLKGAGAFKVGGTRGEFDLVSECDIDGKQGTARVIGYSGNLGIGAPMTQTRGTVEFEDGEIRVNPLVFWGRFTVDSIGGQIGPLGLGRTNIYLGGAVSTKVNTAGGFDIGIQFGIAGLAEVVSFSIGPCGCKVK